jgi:hypothetical protein
LAWFLRLEPRVKVINTPKIEVLILISWDWLERWQVEKPRQVLWSASQLTGQRFERSALSKCFSRLVEDIAADVGICHRATSPSSLATAA